MIDCINVINSQNVKHSVQKLKRLMKSLVTAILASYRGMDTLCETLVIFTAGISVIFIFGYLILDEKTNKTK